MNLQPEVLLQKLPLFRPRFLYLVTWVWVGGFPIPFILFLPLSVAQFGLWIAARVLEQRPSHDHKALQILQTVRAQVGQLRFGPAFSLVETTVKGKMFEEARVGKHALEKVYLKVGLL
jgi:hypothetical protein